MIAVNNLEIFNESNLFMRIIAGYLKGRNFESPHSHKTHPMSEKMRGAMFNVLGDISDLSVFDAYGGSGAIAFEAISRGASKALITELDVSVAKIIKNNIKVLGIESKVKLVRANAASYSKNYPYKHFNLVICDPPYDSIHPSQIIQLTNNVSKEGLLVISQPLGHSDYDLDNFSLELKKIYGKSSLVFYRKIDKEIIK